MELWSKESERNRASENEKWKWKKLEETTEEPYLLEEPIRRPRVARVPTGRPYKDIDKSER